MRFREQFPQFFSTIFQTRTYSLANMLAYFAQEVAVSEDWQENIYVWTFTWVICGAGRTESFCSREMENFMSIKMIHMARTQFRTSKVHRERVHTRKAFAFTGHHDGNLSISPSHSGGPRIRSPPTDSDFPWFFSVDTSQSGVEKWWVKCSEYIYCHSSATMTDVFPWFFLSCKANDRVKLAKTGHGPHSC